MNLSPPLQANYYAEVEEDLVDFITTEIFQPLMSILRAATAQLPATRALRLLNAGEDVLRTALRSGRIQYADGQFSGQFSAAISRALRALGAQFDKRAKVYRLAPSRVPSFVSAESGVYKVNIRAAADALKKALAIIQERLDTGLAAKIVRAEYMVSKVNSGFEKAAQYLQVPATLTPDAKKRFAEAYTDNVKLRIRGMSRDTVAQLRGVVEKNAVEGYRADKLVGQIERRYTVSRARAKFIAREETRLFMSGFHEQRYKEAGVLAYTWSTSNDERVRDDHKRLNNLPFTFANPPIVNRTTGKRANPGGDYGCRCRPIVHLKPVAAQ